MASIKGTRTEKNILTAFAGESQARNRYTYFAAKAKKEGYHYVKSVFEQTANHEKEHAKRLFRFLEGGAVELTATFPAGVVSTTLENLKASIGGENHEHTSMYPEFAAIAKEEGFDVIAKAFESIGIAETFHEERFKKLAELLESGMMFKSNEPVAWVCRNCGYPHVGTQAPEKCPACDHSQGHYQRKEGLL